MSNDLANQGAVSSGLLGSSAQNGQSGLQAHDLQARRIQQGAWNAAVAAGTPFRKAPRLAVEIDKVSNGFKLKSSSGDVLIAKDLEELQGLFIAQVAAMLLEDK